MVEMIPRVSYDPAALFSSRARAAFGPWFAKMKQLPARARYELGEKLGGRLAQHMFYVAPRDGRAAEVARAGPRPWSLRDLVCLQPKSVGLWNLLVSEARQAMREMVVNEEHSKLSAEITFSWPLTIDGFRAHLEVPVLAAEIALAADCARDVSAIREVVLESFGHSIPPLSEEEFLEHAQSFVRFGEALLSVTVRAVERK